MIKIAPIVEGYGDRAAVIKLIHRIARDIDSGFMLETLNPQRIPASKLLKEKGIENAVEYAAIQLQRQGGIVVIIDCDWDDGCPATEGPALLRRAQQTCSDMPISVILAKKEFETWFIAAAESIRGKCNLSPNLQAPESPEEIRGAKEWLRDRMPCGSKYTETEHQETLAKCFDMQLARRRSDSFDKCYRDIEAMLRQLRNRQGGGNQ